MKKTLLLLFVALIGFASQVHGMTFTYMPDLSSSTTDIYLSPWMKQYGYRCVAIKEVYLTTNKRQLVQRSRKAKRPIAYEIMYVIYRNNNTQYAISALRSYDANGAQVGEVLRSPAELIWERMGNSASGLIGRVVNEW